MGASEAQVPIQNYLYAYQHIAFGIPQRYCFKHSPVILRICWKKTPLSDIGIKAWLKGPKWVSQAQVLFSAPDCLCCWQPNGTSLKDNVYMSSRTVCHKESNWSAMATRNIFNAIAASILLDSNGQDLKITQRANLGFRGMHCFCIIYEKCTINFDPYSLVLITFGLIFVKSNMISNIKLIVTNIQMPKDLGLSGPSWPFVWG